MLILLQRGEVLSEECGQDAMRGPDFCVVSIPLGWGGYQAVWLGCDPQLFSLLGSRLCDTFSILLLIPPKEVVSLCPPGAYHLEGGSPRNAFWEVA